MTDIVSGKRVLFITTKNPDYIRNVQEIGLIRKYASSALIIGSHNRHYPVRVLTVFFRLLFRSVRSFDIIFIGFAPQLILPLFRWKFRKKRVIIDFFISLYDTFCQDRCLFRTSGIPGRLLHQIDRITLSLADLVICDTIAHGNFFAQEFQVSPSKLHPYYLEADRSLYHPVSAPRPDALKDKHIVLYFGSILPLQGVDIVLQAMSLLQETPDLFFYFIGPIKARNLRSVCPHAPNIRYISWLSQQELAGLIGISDLCLAGHFCATIAKAGRTIPGKAYIYQAMEKPMILGDNPANHELFAPDENTVFVKMGDPQALADGILNFFRDR